MLGWYASICIHYTFHKLNELIGGIFMTKAQGTSAVHQVDLMWDGWLNNLKSLQSFQEDVQQKALQAFSYQKEMLDLSAKTLNTLEEESKKATNDWNHKIQATVKQSNLNQNEQATKWLTSIQDVVESVQMMAWKPNHVMLDLLTKSQHQVEDMMKNALENQQKYQTENFKKIEELTEQMKVAHKGILNPIKA